MQNLALGNAQLQSAIAQLEALKVEQGSTIEQQVETEAQLREELSRRTAELQNLTLGSAQLRDVVAQLEALKVEQGSTIEQQAETQTQLREDISRRLAEALELERLLALKTDEVEQLTAVERDLQVELEVLSATRVENERLIEIRGQELEALRGLFSEQAEELDRVRTAHASLQDRLHQKVTEIGTLNTRIAVLGDEVSTLTGAETESETTINQLVTDNLQYQDEIGAKQQQIQDLEQRIQLLQTNNEDFKRELDYTRRLQADRQEQIETLQLVMRQLSDDLKARDQRLETLISENERLVKAGTQGDVQIAQLRQAYQDRLAELTNLESALAARSGEVEQLQSELVELKEESQIMLRPARSPANRYVVEVFFSKSLAGDPVFQYRLPGQASATTVSRDELHAMLRQLKNERTEGLYTKVIFPDENQLSFGEAWNFTQRIQSNYDYYSQ